MKNTMRCLGLIALVALIGFSVIACDNSTTSGGGGLNGTYVEASGERLVLNNGSLAFSQNNTEFARGTYSANGNNITGTITQYRGSYLISKGLNYLGLSSSSWYTQQQLRTAFINRYIGQGATQAQAEAYYNAEVAPSINANYVTFTGTLSGNTLTLRISGSNSIYTKQ